MPRIVRTYPARDDLRQIWLHIAKHNLSAADNLIDKVDRTLYALARNPLIGESVEQFRPGLRRFTVGNYVLYYEKTRDGIRLIRVLHGARKAEDLFG